ncbi:MAG: glycosyltransferase [Opitutus sp.]|nr:glycosyltransferase [Opitutus sp.]
MARAEFPGARLLILGGGPLESSLKRRIRKLGLENIVNLAGPRENPFPALKRATCFVLSSNHEGQPMVLLEAMTLGKPIIATDIAGNRGLLRGEYGRLVENSIEGLANGMKAFLRGEPSMGSFSPEEYGAQALRQFRSVITSVPFIVAGRADGLGERLNAMVNAVLLSRLTGLPFRYHWRNSVIDDAANFSANAKAGTGVIVGHAIEPEREVFDSSFINSFSLPALEKGAYVEIQEKDLTAEKLIHGADARHLKGWLAPRLHLDEFLAPSLIKSPEFDLCWAFDQIRFTPTVQAMVTQGRQVPLPLKTAALHLRSGDVFYGDYRKRVYYTYKGLSLPIAKAIIARLQRDGYSILLFGQDGWVLNYLKEASGAILAYDLLPPGEHSNVQRAIFEIVLMSRCKTIIAGSSGFAKLASWIGGKTVQVGFKLFKHLEQFELSREDLAQNAADYPPLQAAFAYWFSYFYSRGHLTVEQSLSLVERAYELDPENQLYAIVIAALRFTPTGYLRREFDAESSNRERSPEFV